VCCDISGQKKLRNGSELKLKVGEGAYVKGEGSNDMLKKKILTASSPGGTFVHKNPQFEKRAKLAKGGRGG